ncbi:endonuclease/exonuclease/phosphatase family protein [Nocardia sp. NBC_00511]|uniref:endonuclease/exonuclease/phosphatase family protein n=1 Tax=Nocardia sp. NBC_00511 TaxID=2903591 RepID=UPI0030E5D3A3
MITVATWNVLHRIHADNWASEVADRWPDESDRIAAVAERVAARTEDVIALQEVSGDQLATLRKRVPDRHFHVLDYPRVPTPRRLPNVLDLHTEHLVLITADDGREVAAESFASDGGKGLIAVELAGIRFIATHVTGDRRRPAQLERLVEVSTPGPAVLLGDFNLGRDALAQAIGPEYTIAEPDSAAVSTRPRTSGTKSQYIDHVVTRGIPVRGMVVEEVAGESDHNLVRAIVG